MNYIHCRAMNINMILLGKQKLLYNYVRIYVYFRS